MVKTSESAIKTVTRNERNWIDTLAPKGNGARRHTVGRGVPQSNGFPVQSRHLTRQTLEAERGNPAQPSILGKVSREMNRCLCWRRILEKANAVL
jgi:hypothetical protein